MKKFGALALAAVMASLVGVSIWGPSVQAQALPHVFSGVATIDGRSVPNGAIIVAVIDGEAVAETSIADGKYALLVAPPRGVSFSGKTVSFTVGGFPASQRARWTRGEIVTLNLSASSKIPGDLNGDGKVNILDLATLGASWNLRAGSTGFNAKSDINGDGQIGPPDLAIIVEAYTPGK